MVAAGFAESNLVLGRPPSMTSEECDPLQVLSIDTQEGHPVVISCWKLTVEELAEINRTGRVWLMVFGCSMPPVSLSVARPFETE